MKRKLRLPKIVKMRKLSGYLGSLRHFQEVHEIKTILIVILNVNYLFLWVDICTNGTKAIVSKNAGSSGSQHSGTST